MDEPGRGTGPASGRGQPEITIDAVANLSSRAYPGGGETRLRFSRGGYDYFVYDLIYSGGIDEETALRSVEDRAGVRVLQDGEQIASLSCTGAQGAGSGGVDSSKLTSKQREEFIDLD